MRWPSSLQELAFTDGSEKGGFAGEADACLILASQDHRLVRTRRELAVHTTLLHELEWHGLAWRGNIANASNQIQLFATSLQRLGPGMTSQSSRW